MTERGFALPLTLLALLALSGVAAAALLVARTEVALEEGELRYLRERIRWEGILVDALAGGEEGREFSGEGVLRSLEAGFVLIRGGAGPAPAYQGVIWALDPDEVVRDLPPAAEVGWGVPGSGVEWGGPECGTGEAAFLVRTRSTAPGGVPDPALDPVPRLGPVGVPSLLPRARGIDPRDPSTFPGALETLVQAAPGARLESGEGFGVLVVPGDLTLSDEVRWTGLVVVTGDLVLEAGAVVLGVALVGGRLQVRDQARLVGCPPRAAEGLRASALQAPFPVPAGGLLGRF